MYWSATWSTPTWFWAWALYVIQFECALGGLTACNILVKLVGAFHEVSFFLLPWLCAVLFQIVGCESLQQGQGDFDIINHDRSLHWHCSWTQCWSFGNPGVTLRRWESQQPLLARGKDLNSATKLVFVTIYIQLQVTAFSDRRSISLRGMTSLPGLS